MVALPEGKAEAEAAKDTRRREADAVRDEKEGIVFGLLKREEGRGKEGFLYREKRSMSGVEMSGRRKIVFLNDGTVNPIPFFWEICLLKLSGMKRGIWENVSCGS